MFIPKSAITIALKNIDKDAILRIRYKYCFKEVSNIKDGGEYFAEQ